MMLSTLRRTSRVLASTPSGRSGGVMVGGTNSFMGRNLAPRRRESGGFGAFVARGALWS